MFILSYIDSLLFLICAYQNNKELLSKGPYRGHDGELISHYRRECLLVSVHRMYLHWPQAGHAFHILT